MRARAGPQSGAASRRAGLALGGLPLAGPRPRAALARGPRHAQRGALPPWRRAPAAPPRAAAAPEPAGAPAAAPAAAPGGDGSSAVDAGELTLYIRRPLAPGQVGGWRGGWRRSGPARRNWPTHTDAPTLVCKVVRHAAGSVCVVGDVPAGARVEAGGDVVILGRLDGAAAAGARPEAGGEAVGAGGAMVAALAWGAAAEVTVGGARAAQVPAGAGQRMAVLEAGAVAFKPLPGSAPDAATAPGPGRSELLSQLLPAAALALGTALAAAPSAVLGGLIGPTGESVAGALLETAVYGYLLLQVGLDSWLKSGLVLAFGRTGAHLHTTPVPNPLLHYHLRPAPAQGATLLAGGSELLLEVVEPGIVGGVLLPVLGALPDALIVLNSGLKGSREDAIEQLAVGMGAGRRGRGGGGVALEGQGLAWQPRVQAPEMQPQEDRRGTSAGVNLPGPIPSHTSPANRHARRLHHPAAVAGVGAERHPRPLRPLGLHRACDRQEVD
jgi:hypothetical protein